MIASPNHSARGSAPVRLVVIHTAEGAQTTAELGHFFANPARQASSHVGIDNNGIEQYVDYTQEAWTIRSANPISDNAELCGFAAWTREQWLNSHMAMLRNAADWIAKRCAARGIPVQKLSPHDIAAGKAGVIGHVDWTRGMSDGSHTDPGDGFPWDVVMELAAGSTPTDSTPTTPEGFLMALTAQQQTEIFDAVMALKAGVKLPARSGNCRIQSDDEYGHILNGEAEAADSRVTAQKALDAVTALTAALKTKGII